MLSRLARSLPFPPALPSRSSFLHTTPACLGLLKGLDPLLTPDLLWVLRSAGHGDEIVICDVNFPAAEVASKSTTGKHVLLAGADLVQTVDAVCSVMPLDLFVPCPAEHMAPTEGDLPPLGQEVIDQSAEAIRRHSEAVSILPCERFEFYDRARQAYAVVQCAERRPYGNWILKKGVVGPDGNDLGP